MAHACNDSTVESFLRRAGSGRALYEAFEALIAACGPYDVSPAYSRVTFLARVRFAGVNSVSERGMTCYFAFPRALAGGRFRRVQEIVPGWWQHTLRVTHETELDAQLLGWLRESYRLMGMQERLAAENRPRRRSR